MSKDFYKTLWVYKSATQDEIKKAYRKQAMKYHPDKNKGDSTAEGKFKEVNEAYQTLSDSGKRQNYDTFWSGWARGNPFGGWWNPFSWAGSTSYSSSDFSGFEDIFSWFWGWGRSQSSGGFNMEDLFGGGMWSQRSSPEPQSQKPVSLDFEKTYEVPIFDLILGCSIEVKWVYGTKKKLRIPAGTKSNIKMRVKWLWKKEGSKAGNLIVKIVGIMPKNISDVDKQMLERIRDNVWY